MVERAKILFQPLAAIGFRNNDDSLTESRYALTGLQCVCPQDLNLLQILLHKLHCHRPSPTAEATRLTEPDRTSPAANTPAQLVSSKNGERRAVQSDCVKAGPVRINPRESVSISLGSQSLRGTAPIKLKSAGVSSVRTSPVPTLPSQWSSFSAFCMMNMGCPGRRSGQSSSAPLPTPITPSFSKERRIARGRGLGGVELLHSRRATRRPDNAP
jgi:hypothetical protein